MHSDDSAGSNFTKKQEMRVWFVEDAEFQDLRSESGGGDIKNKELKVSIIKANGRNIRLQKRFLSSKKTGSWNFDENAS